MKIILVNPPSHTYRNPEEHLGLAYLKSFLKVNKFNVDIIDGYLLGLSCRQVCKKIFKDKQVKIVGLSPSIDSLKESIEISNEIKKNRPDIFICWGGHLASFSAEDLLNNYSCVDFIVRGEGEITLLEIVKRNVSVNKFNLKNINGVVYRENGKVVFSDPRNLIEDLDDLPFPDRLNTQKAVKQGSLVEISGSRGCYGNCSFCSINSLYKLSGGKKWRGRSAKNIVDELEQLNRKFGFSMFKFIDDSFFGPGTDSQERVEKIAEEIIKRDLKIRFRISIRSNDVDKKVFIKLKKAGLYAVSIGIESGFQRALNTFNKGTTTKQNKKALKVLKDLKIITLMGFIGFDPYMSLPEVKKNVTFLETTTFCMSDIISKPLFVHAQDKITQQLIKDKLVDGRDFPNYTYIIKDKKVQTVFESLKYWNSFNKELFYKVSDPLTAPRITLKKDELKLLRLHLQMRKIDINIYKKIVKLVNNNKAEKEIKIFLDKQRKIVIPKWQQIDKKFNLIVN